MANLKAVDVDKLDADLTSVADAIRAKGETSGSLAFPDGFVNAVNDISSTEVVEPKIEPITIKENGVYNADGVDGYAPITVEIDIPEPTPPVIKPITITDNGVYEVMDDTDGFSPITVDVKPNITPITIKENGEYTAPDGVDGHSPIKVEVEIPTPVVEPLTVTENGTYSPPDGVDGYAPVTVEVEGEGGSLIDPSWTSGAYLFSNGRANDEFDTSSSKTFSNMFYDCKALKEIPSLNTSKGTAFGSMCYSCSALETVISIDVSLGTSSGALNQTFMGCSKLKNITFVGTINVSITFSRSPLLTIDSLKSIITALKDYAGTSDAGKYTLTLHADSKALLENEGATAPNGLTWIAFAESKGWNIA